MCHISSDEFLPSGGEEENGERRWCARMIVRVRHSAGTWRVPDLAESTTIGEFKQKIEVEHGISAATQQLSRDPSGADLLDTDEAASLGALGIKHGDMLHLLGRVAQVSAPSPLPSPLRARACRVLLPPLIPSSRSLLRCVREQYHVALTSRPSPPLRRMTLLRLPLSGVVAHHRFGPHLLRNDSPVAALGRFA